MTSSNTRKAAAATGKIDASKVAESVISQEITGLEALRTLVNDNFLKAIDLLLACKGRVIVSGMGKSGHIARKMAATFASTGTPAMFVHPGEASHGDLGMITTDDVVILLSNSGETEELHDIIHYCTRFSIPLIAMVRKDGSLLGEAATLSFVLPDIAEATEISAPTTSTTMMLVWGDVLALSLLELRGFSKDDFKRLHPGGKLGKQLLKVADVMRKDGDLPMIKLGSTMADAVIVISEKRLGCVVVVDNSNHIAGIVTDGDLRRHMQSDLLKSEVNAIMSPNPVRIGASMFATEALAIMNEKQITTLPVVDDNNALQGVLHIHDLLREGVV